MLIVLNILLDLWSPCICMRLYAHSSTAICCSICLQWTQVLQLRNALYTNELHEEVMNYRNYISAGRSETIALCSLDFSSLVQQILIKKKKEWKIYASSMNIGTHPNSTVLISYLTTIILYPGPKIPFWANSDRILKVLMRIEVWPTSNLLPLFPNSGTKILFWVALG